MSFPPFVTSLSIIVHCLMSYPTPRIHHFWRCVCVYMKIIVSIKLGCVEPVVFLNESWLPSDKDIRSHRPCTQKIIKSRPGSDISLGFLNHFLEMTYWKKVFVQGVHPSGICSLSGCWKGALNVIIQCIQMRSWGKQAEPLSKTSYCLYRSSSCPLASSVRP